MSTLKNRFFFGVSFFLFWTFYFVFARAFFLVYYFSKTQDLNTTTILNTFSYGIKLDIAFAAYLCIIPFFFFQGQQKRFLVDN